MPAAVVRAWEGGCGSGAGRQQELGGAGGGAGGDIGRPVIERQGNVAGARAVVVGGDVDFPGGGVGGGAAHADLAQAAVFNGVGDQKQAEVARRRGGGGIVLRSAAGADVGDFAGAASGLGLDMAREGQGLIEIQGGRAGLRRENRDRKSTRLNSSHLV